MMLISSSDVIIRSFYLCAFLIAITICSENVKLEELPFCGTREATVGRRLVFVSTLDGKLSALNIEDGGLEQWSISTGPGPMLSSSIHTLELTNNGQWVRMIPSLSGGLYKFDGDNIEPVPVTADKLLHSSFRYSDDIIISGGKESRTYGVDAATGKVLYECSMTKCDNLTSKEVIGDVVLVQRLTQTVRAVEPRSGVERWNFSVGEHNVKMSLDPNADCHNKVDKSNEILLKVIVPDGLVCAMSASKPSTVLWQHKFNFPVVSAWQMVKGEVKWVDLFGGAPRAGVNKEGGGDVPTSPLLYIGMHNKQLYIQESVVLQQKMLESITHPALPNRPAVPAIPWKPHPASSIQSVLGIGGPSEPVLQITDNSQAEKTTALSVLYASEYVNGNGFFLYGPDKKKESNVCPPDSDKKVNITITTHQDDEDDDYTFVDFDEDVTQNEKVEYIVQFFPLSLWYWWREILVISLSTAILVNCANKKISNWWKRQILLGEGIAVVEESAVATTMTSCYDALTPPCDPGGAATTQPPLGVATPPPPPPQSQFVSRYLTDFEPLHCLGRGGFGIVFQARNKIDDCHYAIKRIPLPNKEESRERVMREVKALAKLDHQNIVRFFNAWLECPPSNWQEDQDTHWANIFHNDSMSGGGGEAFTVDLTGHVTPTSEIKSLTSATGKEKKDTVRSGISSLLDRAASLYSSLMGSKHVVPRTLGDSDSFIVFGEEGASEGGDRSVKADATPGSRSATTTHSRRPTTLNLEKRSSGGGTSLSSRPARMFLYIQMQLCRPDSLKDWLQDPAKDRKDSLVIFDQIVQAVEYVHLQGLIHRDLKPSNIFFSPEGQIKVGDFGLVTAMVENLSDDFHSPLANRKRATTPSEKHTAMVGTQLYMSPEQLDGQQYNYKVDIYSLGLILYELLVPFSTQMERSHALTQIKTLSFPQQFTMQYKNEHDLLLLMLSKNPDERPTTIGIRCRPPLRHLQLDPSTLSDEWHFKLPLRARDSSFSKSSSQESASS